MSMKADGFSGEMGVSSARSETASVGPRATAQQASAAHTRRFEQIYQQRGGKRRPDAAGDVFADAGLGAGAQGVADLLAGRVAGETEPAPPSVEPSQAAPEVRVVLTLPRAVPTQPAAVSHDAASVASDPTTTQPRASVPVATEPPNLAAIEPAPVRPDTAGNLADAELAQLARRVIVRQAPETNVSAAPGDAILHGWQRLTGEPVHTQTPAQPVSRLAGAVEMWLSRNQGTHPAVRQARFEVVLPQGEIAQIQVHRDGDGLQVRLTGPGDQINTWLHENSQALQQRLQQRTGLDVAVRVDGHGGHDPHQDGRSRQQRDLYQELDDDGARFNRPLRQSHGKRGSR